MEWVWETLGERVRVAEAVIPALKDKGIEQVAPYPEMSQIGGEYSDVGYSFFCFRGMLLAEEALRSFGKRKRRTPQSENSGGTTIDSSRHRLSMPGFFFVRGIRGEGGF